MIVPEAASALGISPQTVRTQIRKGRLRASRRGRDYWITSAEVERYRRDSLGKAHRPLGAKDKAPRQTKRRIDGGVQ